MPFDVTMLFAFIAASTALVIMPGPSITVIIANSMKHGAKAGLLTIAGGQLGLLFMVLILALGLHALTTTLAWLFDWVRLLGAAYLVYLGVKLWRSDGTFSNEGGADQADNKSAHVSNKTHFWQGFLVSISNPKTLLFFGAFIPQFIVGEHHTGAQVLFFGLLFMVIAAIFDSLYALAAGKAGRLLTRRNMRLAEKGSGSMMIGGGLWLALAR